MGTKRYITALFLMVVCAVSSLAQYEGTTVEQRLGKGRDLEINRNFYNDFVAAFGQRDYKTAYRPWRELMDRAPFATFTLSYYGGCGDYMLRSLIENETDTIQRWMYFEDLMEMMDFALKNYKALNPIDPQQHPNVQYTEPKLLCWKAWFYYDLGRKHLPEDVYSKEDAYQNFDRAFKAIRSQNLQADAANDGVIISYMTPYFESCRDLYETDKDKYLEQFLSDYVSCLETCDKMMSLYQHTDSILYGSAAAVRNNTQVFFNETGAGSTENLVRFYTPRLKDNAKNGAFLDNAVHMMFANNCIGEDVFYDYCEKAYMLKPNYENCIGMGLLSQDVEGDRDEAKRLFDQANQLAQTPNEHYIASKFTADALAKTPQPKQNEGESNTDFNSRLESWRNIMRAATIYYNQALDYAAQTSIQGQYLADVYYTMADCYRKAQDYSNANTCLVQTKACYALFNDDKYNNMQAAIQSGAENKAKRDAAYQAQLKNKAQQDAYRKRYEEQLRKQREEEAFWGKK